MGTELAHDWPEPRGAKARTKYIGTAFDRWPTWTDAGGEKPTAERRETQEVRQGSSSRGIPPHHAFRKNWIATNTGEEMHATVTRR